MIYWDTPCFVGCRNPLYAENANALVSNRLPEVSLF